MKFALITKIDDHSNEISIKIKNALINKAWREDSEKPDLVICVGGDGTILYAVHKFINALDDVKFVGVHTGTLGFLTDYTDSELDIFINDLVKEEFKVFESRMLEIKIGDEKPLYALNEMRIENAIKTQNVDIYVDNEFFESCRGSGICISSQAGATAYIRGLNGAVIDNGLQVLQLAEITPIQHAKHRSLRSPYIMSCERVIQINSSDFEDATLCYDHLNRPLKGCTSITCSLSKKSVKFARFRNYSYLKRLKNLY